MSEANTLSVTHNLKLDEISFATNGLTNPVLYADTLRGAMVSTEVAKFNLVQNLVDAKTNQIMAVHVATIVLPTSQLEAWGQWLIELAKNRVPTAVEETPNGSL